LHSQTERNTLKFLLRKGKHRMMLTNAKVAQLVEHDLAKVGVASSNLVFRSKCLPTRRHLILKALLLLSSDGGTGRHAGLKILCPQQACGFDSRSEYKTNRTKSPDHNRDFFYTRYFYKFV
jgi:hypothetical protein